MKRKILSPIFIMILALLPISYIHAQAPEGIIYQAEARSANGRLIRNTNLDVKITILAGSPSGTVVWDGFYEVTTDRFGLFTIVIGEGTGGSFDFSVIDWGSNTHFLNVQIKRAWASWWIDMGTTQFLSVPYALHAKTASSVLEIDPVFTSSSAYWITSGNIANWDAAFSWGDHSLAGYLTSQEWSNLSGIPEGFEDGIDDVDDADASPLNELQNLTLEDDILKLSLTNDEVSLENYVTPWEVWSDDLVRFTGAVDIGDNYFSGSVLRVDGNVTVGKRGENAGMYSISGPVTESGLSLRGGKFGSQLYLFGTDHASHPNEIHLRTLGTERIFVEPDGNVGIGTTTPDYKLDVSGDINFTGQILHNGNPFTTNDADPDPTNEIQNLASVLTQSNNGGAIQIKDIADPTEPQDVVTKAHLDNLLIQLIASEKLLNAGYSISTLLDGGHSIVDLVNAGGSVSDLLNYGISVFELFEVGVLVGTLEQNGASQQELSDAGLIGIVTDIDGNTYKWVRIGNQYWMAENLKTSRYNDGIPLEEAGTGNIWSSDRGAYCWYDDLWEVYEVPYGALYNGLAIGRGNLCPTGWNVPTSEEFSELSDYLGGMEIAAKKLKEIGMEHWSTNTGTNESGFTAVAGGYVYNGYSREMWETANFWTSTIVPTYEQRRFVWRLFDDDMFNDWDGGLYPIGYSVRCIKD